MSGKLKTGIVLAVMLIAAAGFMAYKKMTPPAGGQPGEMAHGGGQGGAPQAMPVPVAVAEKKPLRIWTSYSGRMMAIEYVELRPQVDGRIQEIKFADGQLVNKGDVLFVIDPRPYEATATQAEAAIKAAQSQHDLAVKELKRAEELIQSGTIPKRVLDERQNAAQLAINALNAAKAALEKAQINVDHAYVEAPVSGRVSRPEITVGNVVQSGPNAPVLTTIVSSEGIYADFEVDEQTYLGSVRPYLAEGKDANDIPVQLVVGNDGRVYEGHIKSFDNQINISTGTIRARAFLANEDGTLLPGMFVTVRLGSPSIEDVMLLTEHAIGTDQNRKFVYVISDGKATYREVKLGASVDGNRVILSGLEPGEQVISEGIMKIMPGMPVMPMEAPPPMQAEGNGAALPETAPAAGEKQDHSGEAENAGVPGEELKETP